jgi:hypothetical protein
VLLQSKILNRGMHRLKASFPAPLVKNCKPWALSAQTGKVGGHLQLSLYPNLTPKDIVHGESSARKFTDRTYVKQYAELGVPLPNSPRYYGFCEDLFMSPLWAIGFGSSVSGNRLYATSFRHLQLYSFTTGQYRCWKIISRVRRFWGFRGLRATAPLFLFNSDLVNCLLQWIDDILLTLGFLSGSFGSPSKSWPVVEKEAYAVVVAMTLFEHIVFGRLIHL